MTTALGQVALGAWVRASGRSWWQAGYLDGKVRNEFETADNPMQVLARLGRGGSTSKWEELPKVGLRALRLLTPIGKIGHLETDRDHALFQLKLGGISVSVGGSGGSRWCDAHLIGKLINADGDCELMAYEYGQRPYLRGPLRDNVFDLRYGKIGPLALDVLGIRT